MSNFGSGYETDMARADWYLEQDPKFCGATNAVERLYAAIEPVKMTDAQAEEAVRAEGAAIHAAAEEAEARQVNSMFRFDKSGLKIEHI